MKIYFVASPGSRIVARKGGLYIVRRGRDDVERVAVPPDVDALVIASSSIGISSKAVRLAATRGIDIVFLDYTGYPIARVYPPYINKTIATRVAQYKPFLSDYGKKLAKELVYAKIVNQAELVRYIARDSLSTPTAFTASSTLLELETITSFFIYSPSP
jgi:CRISPR-associated protein Cas1